MRKEINPMELDFLLRFPAVPNSTSPVDFLSNLSWGGIKVRVRACVRACVCDCAYACAMLSSTRVNPFFVIWREIKYTLSLCFFKVLYNNAHMKNFEKFKPVRATGTIMFFCALFLV